MLPWPRKCKDCSEAEKQRFGCGPWEGKAKLKYAQGAPELRTCPRACWLDPDVRYVFAQLDLWTDKRLDVRDLPAPLVDYYRAAALAQRDWLHQQQETEAIDAARRAG